MKYFKIPMKIEAQIVELFGDGDTCPGDIVDGELRHNDDLCWKNPDLECYRCRLDFVEKYTVEE